MVRAEATQGMSWTLYLIAGAAGAVAARVLARGPPSAVSDLSMAPGPIAMLGFGGVDQVVAASGPETSDLEDLELSCVLPPDSALDFRSDTFTLPTPGMRKAMAEAEVGDDVFGEDPTVNELERRMAELFGKEAGLFVASGTMSNLLAAATHCPGRGDAVILGDKNHMFVYEQGGASSIMGAVYHTVPTHPDGTVDLQAVDNAVRPSNAHFTTPRVLCIENTQGTVGGRVIPLSFFEEARKICDKHQLALHCDGARIWNAAHALGCDVASLTATCDTVSACLSKGLGAPVGSVLVGPADFIERARRLRKAIGGGMRQAGVLAAAGLYALEHNLPRVGEDNARAAALRKGLVDLGLDCEPTESNMVLFHHAEASSLATALDKVGVKFLSVEPTTCRLVVHQHISDEDVSVAISVFREALEALEALSAFDALDGLEAFETLEALDGP